NRLAVAGRLRPELAGQVRVLARDGDQRPPAGQGRQLGVEGQGARDLQEARGALGAFDVAPQPEAVVGDARDHVASACTQVSFEPPPWLEFTMYEPVRSATRVSPPGMTQLPWRPVSTKGRRSIRRGSTRRESATQVGQVDSSIRCCAM